ncbi:MAG: serine/threonine protein kinase [Phycisphaeraceae bacterium]|nr:serine/threonine protein kinase [Phycisphaeraceae bacterium]
MSSSSVQANLDTILGRLVVEQGLADGDEVAECLKLVAETRKSSGEDESQRSLAHVLVERGVVTRKQLDRLRPKAQDEQEQTRSQQIPGFQIVRRLGSGAMATVYLAKQLSLDRLVAIKVLPKKYTNNEDFVSRFYAEGRAAARLNHPNIVAAYDVGQAGDFHYFVMEYVNGHTVYDDLTSNKQYDEKEALRIALQIARALDHAHKAGFIHRDVKPKNVMLTKEGTAKLADMGLARAVSDREAAEAEAGKAFGTPYYISPEQIRGLVDVDYRCDIYGLGATLYHMVTGRVPFDGPNPSAVMHKHLRAELIPPDHIRSDLTTGISEVIEVAMAKDRKDRYRSTEDMLNDLEEVAEGRPPLQARQKFDLSALTDMEATAIGNDGPELITSDSPATPLVEQPVFWAAVAGWVIALALLITLMVR